MASPATSRAAAIDLLRGLVMALMVLDHARDFFCGFGMRATDLATTTPALFFTRWITHFCAPTFLLLAGLSAGLYGEKRGPAALRRFLWTRGLWLVVLELTVVRFGWIPDPLYRFTLLQVIWATGWAMVLLAALTWLPRAWVGVLGLAVCLGHPLGQGLLANPADLLLLGNGALEPAAGHKVMVSYAILPWFGVLALGFGLVGSWQVDRRRLAWLGAALVAGFVALRLTGVGDPEPFVAQSTPLRSLMAWINTDKYPASPAYLAMTLGPALLLLAVLPDQPPTWGSCKNNSIELSSKQLCCFCTGPWTRALLAYGRVPLFFYVAHLWLLRWTSIPVAIAQWGELAFALPPKGHAMNPGWPLWAAYLVWVGVLVLLVRPSLWWARKKAAGRAWWWAYL